MSGARGLVDPELPKGWAWKPLGEIAEVIRGVTYKKDLVGLPGAPNHIPLLRATNIEEAGLILGEFVWVPENLVREPQLLRVGDLVVAASSGSLSAVGKAAQVERPIKGTFGAFCAVVRPDSSAVDPRFLRWFMASNDYRHRVSSLAAGSNINNLKRSHLLEMPVPFPPRAQQEEIVLAIESKLVMIDHASEQLALVRKKTSGFRLALLAEAVAGDWPRIRLKDALVSLRNGIFVSRPGPEPPGVAIFRISAVRPGSLDPDDVRYAPPEIEGHEGFFVSEGDLLFTRYSGNANLVGACARVKDLPRPTLHPDKLIRGVVDHEVADPAFLELACSAGQTANEIRSRRKTTAGQVGIAGGQLATVTLPLPPLQTQRRIAEDTGQHLTAVAALQSEIGQAEELARRLRASILRDAFHGRLLAASSQIPRPSQRAEDLAHA